MDSLLEKLAFSQQPSESSEHLKVLGKRAAGLYINDNAKDLGDAVQRVISEEPGLNRDQVRRVAEMANQAAWQAQFHEGGDPETHFEPANGDSVLNSLAERTEEVQSPNFDYFKDPGEKPPEGDLAEAFGVKDNESEEYEHLNPVSEEEAAVEKTSSAADFAEYAADKLVNVFHESRDEFCNLVKQAHLSDGHGLLQISKAVAEVMESPTFAEAIMQDARTRLEESGVNFDIDAELEKISHPLVVNTEHPLVQAAANLEKVAKGYACAMKAKSKSKASNKRALSFLKDKMRGT
jgi:hypothetical protein